MSLEKSKVSAEDIENLIEVFKQSGWDEMHLETAGLELFLSNDPNATGPRANAPAVDRIQTSAATSPPAAVVPEPKPSAHGAAAPIPEGMIAVRAPNLGTFYRAPKPGAPAYVDLGSQVEVATEICLIEVMKLFAPVSAGIKGIVREIRARDGQMVEFDDVLMVVEPN